MTKWIELEKRLTTKQTIDKHIQEQINKEKEHCSEDDSVIQRLA